MVTIPIRCNSKSNARVQWWDRAATARAERAAAYLMVAGQPLPVVVTITRGGPRKLDDDNVRDALKSIRDGVADRHGVDDNDPRISFQYAQETTRRGVWWVRVEVRSVPGPDGVLGHALPLAKPPAGKRAKKKARGDRACLRRRGRRR